MEINPQSNVVPDYPSATYTPCNPGPNPNDVNNKWQTIWNGTQYKLDPYQQLFNKQFGGIQELNVSDFYTIEIIENAQYADIVKLGYYNPETGEMIDSIHIGDLLENVSGLELTGTGDWEYTICGTKEKEFNSKYVVNFSRDVPQNTVVTIMLTDLTTGDTKYFHTRIAVPTMNFDNPVSEDTLGILHYYSVELPITLSSEENWCSSCGGSIPGWVTFTIEITNGQQYGNLYNKNTGEHASSFTNIIANQNWSCGNSITDYDFIADGVQPDSLIPAVVKVRCTASDGEIGIWERNIYVSYNDVEPVEEGIIISFSKDHLAPGDTAEIILQRQNTDGSVVDFTEWDSFEIGITEGCGGGKIMVGDSLDSYFSEAYQPIYFVADSTITDTSITVGIRAGLIQGIIGASRMQNNNNQQEEKSDFKRNKKTVNKPVNKTNTQNTVQNNPAASCFGGTIERNIAGNGKVVVKQDGCDEEIVVCESFEPQKINENAVEILGANQNWQWIDRTGEIFTTNIGEPCIYDESPTRGHGMTKALIQIPYFKDAPEPIYNIFEDMRLAVCLDTREIQNKKWQFDVDNIRIPIYMSLCPREGWIDLGDGMDYNVLNSYISNCEILGEVTYWLDKYWIPGQHFTEIKPVTTNKYVFSKGTLKNEEYHLNRFKYAIPSAINDSLSLLRTDRYKYLNEIYTFSEDVIAAKTLNVQELVIRGRNSWPSKMETAEIEERNSDNYSRDTYKQIRQNIINWAKQQSWWAEADVFCQDAISGH